MTKTRYLWTRLQRLEQRHRAFVRRTIPPDAQSLMLLLEPAELAQARADLKRHVDTKVRPSFTDIVWRSKKEGGPLRLQVRHIDTRLAA